MSLIAETGRSPNKFFSRAKSGHHWDRCDLNTRKKICLEVALRYPLDFDRCQNSNPRNITFEGTTYLHVAYYKRCSRFWNFSRENDSKSCFHAKKILKNLHNSGWKGGFKRTNFSFQLNLDASTLLILIEQILHDSFEFKNELKKCK